MQAIVKKGVFEQCLPVVFIVPVTMIVSVRSVYRHIFGILTVADNYLFPIIAPVFYISCLMCAVIDIGFRLIDHDLVAL